MVLKSSVLSYAATMSSTGARHWHAGTAVTAVLALALQLVLVGTGSAVLAEHDPPGLALRLGRFASYFTIQSNLLVAVAAITLARDPTREGTGWRVLRLAGIVGITLTGLVHFFLLRPLLDLDGLDYLADKLLHVAVPLLALVGWAVFGPRPRASLRTAGLACLWPLAWLAWTLGVGALTGWYPYPFLDPAQDGTRAVLMACGAITGLVLALFAAALAIDRRAVAAPQ